MRQVAHMTANRMYLKEIGWEGVKINVAQNRDQWRILVNK
jgi:hypothetical protein